MKAIDKRLAVLLLVNFSVFIVVTSIFSILVFDIKPSLITQVSSALIYTLFMFFFIFKKR